MAWPVTNQGVSAEVMKAIEEGTVPRVNCLNCRIVRSPSGGLRVEVQTVNTPGLVGEALKKIVRELRLATPYATTARQKAQLELLVRFFETLRTDISPNP